MPRLVTYLSESPLGVAYFRCAPGASGLPGPPHYWDHKARAWTPVWSPRSTVAPMVPPIPLARPAYQSFAPPTDVLEDPNATAIVLVLRADGSIASDLDVIPGPTLAGLSGGPMARP